MEADRSQILGARDSAKSPFAGLGWKPDERFEFGFQSAKTALQAADRHLKSIAKRSNRPRLKTEALEFEPRAGALGEMRGFCQRSVRTIESDELTLQSATGG